MKKIISIILVALMLLPSLLISPTAAEEKQISYPFEVSSFTDLSSTGVRPGANSAHGNHQIRTVHTSHGDYAAYITNSYEVDDGIIDQWSLFRIDAESGKAEVIFTGEKYQESSQVSLLVDKDENVWAITASSDYYRSMKTEGVDVRAHRYDPKTGEVSSYTSIIAGGTQDIYGYSTSYYDHVNNRIIALFSGGTYSEDGTKGSFDWVIFDMNTNRWLRHIYYVRVPSRHCYMNGYIDDNGGLMFVAVRDVACIAVGYPEIGSNDGISEEDWQYLWNNNINRWNADYCWDQLELFYIPDLKTREIISYNVIKADYSRVEGTQEERNSLEYRFKNFYPQNLNSNGGDFLVEETDDGRTLLHITYNSVYVQAGMDRTVTRDDIWYHQVWDITDPKNAKKIYNEPIVTEAGIADCNATNSNYSFRLYKDKDSQVYLISGRAVRPYYEYNEDGSIKNAVHPKATLSVYRVIEKDGCYTYKKLPKTASLPGSNQVINISSPRGGSLIDNTLNILYYSGTYYFANLSISDLDITLGDINGDGEINGKDSNIIKQFISGIALPKELEAYAADINCDENLNANDSNLLLRYLSGALDSFQ
ncbi:MAG: hypothetical protein IJA52_04075 [Clostridia bacterium]|nr:hypothetical protein [Clostridia bacterium]